MRVTTDRSFIPDDSAFERNTENEPGAAHGHSDRMAQYSVITSMALVHKADVLFRTTEKQ